MKKNPALICAVSLAAFAPASGLTAITFTNNTTISGSIYDGQDIVVDRCVVGVSGVHSFASLQVLDGGVLTSAGPSGSLGLIITGDALIGSAGKLFLDAVSTNSTEGVGGTSGGPPSGSGGGHGGNGGQSESLATPGAVYGSTTEPNRAGSRGGFGLNGPGGAGGGTINVQVAGQLHVDGAISANGGNGTNSRSGGGSGGSVWISAGLLSGSGSILAKGGDGEPDAGGGGGGGRIALYFNTNQFTGEISARGGKGYRSGGAGTIYTKPAAQAGRVLFNNGDISGLSVVLQMPSDVDLWIQGGATVAPRVPLRLRNLAIGPRAWLFVTNQGSALTVTGDGLLEAGGGIHADSANSLPGQGDGGRTSVSSIYVTVGGGGGHGGYGGAMPASFNFSGNAFDSVAVPSLPGGRGGGSSLLTGPPGGGVVRLTVNGLLVCNGRISADGGNAQDAYAGGGAGGSLQLTIGTLAGAGTISANGGAGLGDGVNSGGGGGGGRISIQYGANFFLGSITALGGPSLKPGGAGTIYMKGATARATLLVDNGGQRGTNTLLGGSSGYDLTVRRGARVVMPVETIANLLLSSNGWLTIAGGATTSQPMRVTGDAVIEAGAGILVDGLGYRAASGPGAGGSIYVQPIGRIGVGGGYGGYGGQALTNLGAYGAGGAAYGSVNKPIESGSGGGGGDTRTGGAGGGAVYLSVAGTLVLSGTISANGTAGSTSGSGGGSGGGILIETGTLMGSGLITANGGSGLGLGGGGGGGRIAVQYGSNSFDGAVSAFGGLGARGGGAGTIYLKPTTGPGRVVADNGGRAGTNTLLSIVESGFDLEIGDGASVWAPGSSLVVSNLMLRAGGTLTFQPSQTNMTLTVLGSAIIESNALVSVNGKGYAIGSGPGAGLSQNQVGSGAGYGGVGGASSRTNGGSAYGFAPQPIERGSGGGRGYGLQTAGSEGGGTLLLNINRVLMLDGGIAANGNDAASENAGGGAGGSVWINAGSLMGRGFIQADGGAGELLEGGGGAGGRIAIYSPVNGFLGMVSAAGGEGFEFGQTGSVFYAEAPLPLEVIGQIPAGTTDQAVSSVILQLNTLVNRSTLSASDLIITDPDGSRVQPSLSVSNGGPSSIVASFQPQTKEGVYTVRFGPQVQNIHGATMSNMYTGSFRIVWPVVIGRVLDTNHQAVAGVMLQPSAGGTSANTDNQGFYALKIVPGQSLVVTPTKTGYLFEPASRTYSGVSGTLLDQDYVAMRSGALALESSIVTKNLVVNWEAMPGVQYQALYSTNLADWLPCPDSVVGTNDAGQMQLVFPIEGGPRKFYRVRTLQ